MALISSRGTLFQLRQMSGSDAFAPPTYLSMLLRTLPSGPETSVFTTGGLVYSREQGH